MQGLEEYIEKYGEHFTEQLAIDATNSKWSSGEIEKTAESIVYYNLSKATLGDIIFLTNLYYKHIRNYHSKVKCVKSALRIIEDINTNSYAFNYWLQNIDEYDLTGYL